MKKLNLERKNRNIVAILFMILALPALAQTPQDSVFKTIALDSITVSARKPMVKTTGTTDEIAVKGTYLSRTGSLNNMFQLTPGLIMKSGKQVEVVGAGAPLFVIDGREVTQPNMLDAVKADNVSRIVIDRHPGSEYPEGTAAVIRIYTIKPLKDFVSLNLSNGLDIKRKVSDMQSVDFSAKIGKWITSLSGNTALLQNLNKETYFTIVHHDDSEFRSDEANRDLNMARSHGFVWTNDFMLNAKNRISFVYDFAYEKNKDFNDETMTYQGGMNNAVVDMDINQRSWTRTHNFTLQYNSDLGEDRELNLTADYTIRHNTLGSHTHERYRATGREVDILTDNKNKYDVFTLNGTYGFVLPGDIKAKANFRYYHVHNPTDYVTDNYRVGAEQRRHSLTAKDDVTAGALLLSKSWKKILAQFGVRYEYTDTRLTAPSGGKDVTVGHHTSDLLPQVYIKYSLTKRMNLFLTYNRSVTRQGYRDLDVDPIYHDTLNYSVGNNRLRPSYKNDYSFYVSYAPFTLRLRYVQTKDAMRTVKFAPDAGSNVTNDQPVNLGNMENYIAMLTWSKTVGRFYLYANGSLSFPHFRYPFWDEMVRPRRMGWLASLYASYTVNSHLALLSRFDVQSRSNMYNTVQRSANNWIVGAQGSWLNDRLNVSVTVTDMLHKANYNNMTARYINTSEGTYGTNDMRGVSINVSYKLFNREISTRGSSDNSEVISRTKNR